MPSALRHTLCLLLLGVGVGLWLTAAWTAGLSNLSLAIVGGAVLIALLWPISRALWMAVSHWCEALRSRSGWTALAVFVITALLFFYEASLNDSNLFLKVHDEHSYMIQARMLAHGKLWLPAYPAKIQPFFDTFHVIVDRVYASIYFPGVALLEVPGVWLRWPYWVVPLLTASAVAALLYLVLVNIFDGVRALVGVLLLQGVQLYHLAAFTLAGQTPFLLSELLLLWAWLRWRRRQDPKWAIVIGVAVGYGAITRPLDALCYSAVVGVAMVADGWGAPRRLLAAAGLIALFAAPFLSIQLVQDIGVTGQWRVSPEAYYVAEDYPAPVVGFYHAAPRDVPHPACAPKQQWLRWVLPMYAQHTPANVLASLFPDRYRSLVAVTLADPLLVILAPVGLLSLGERRRLVLVLGAGVVFVAYLLNVFVLDHYLFVTVPAAICLVLAGWESLDRAWPRQRILIDVFLLLALSGLSAAQIGQSWKRARLGITDHPEQQQANQVLSRLPNQPAVVLFRYDPASCNFQDEPVYNDDVAWPDDARIIRARDLGDRENQAIYDYYARRDPQRVFYRYDRAAAVHGENPLTRLGTAAQLADTRPD